MGINSDKVVPRKAKNITNNNDIEYILSISSKDAAKKSTIMELFGDFGDGPRFNPYDTITIPKGAYGGKKKNKNDFKTTVGLYIYNKGSIEPFADLLGYVNEPVTGDVFENINNKLSYARLEDKITLEQLKRFIMQTQIYMSCASAIAPSHTMGLIMLSPKIEKKKKELLKNKYGDKIKDNDIMASAEMESELINYAKNDILRNDPSLDMYDSKARASYSNQFKNMYISKGSVKMTDGSYRIVESSHMASMDKNEFSTISDSAIGGPYSRAVKTKDGGYLEKLILAALQHVVVLKPGSDCGTKDTITVTLTKKNINGWMYSFYVQGSKLIEITSDNRDSLIGKTVKMRYSALCKSKNGICEKCAGTLFNRLGIKAAGLACDAIGSTAKNKSMKAFHNSVVKFSHIDIDDVFGF